MAEIIVTKETGATPSEKELGVVDILVQNQIPKQFVLFLCPSRIKGVKTPDIMIDNDVRWEIKSLERFGKY